MTSSPPGKSQLSPDPPGSPSRNPQGRDTRRSVTGKPCILEQKLAGIGLFEPAVTVELVSVIERMTSGELQRFVPRRGATTLCDRRVAKSTVSATTTATPSARIHS